MTVGIYQLKFSDGSIYIGLSVDIEKRFNTHKRTLANNTHHNKLVQEKYQKLGMPIFSILEICSEDTLYTKETYYAELVPKNLLLNISETGHITTVLKGELNGRSKYSNEDVVDILLALANSDISKKELAEISPVSYTMIRQIASGTAHRWLKDVYPTEYILMLSKIKKSTKHIVKDPSGVLHTVTSQREFARNNPISLSSLNHLITGKTTVAKGWTLVE